MNNLRKALIGFVFALVLMVVPATVNAATNSPAKKVIKTEDVSVNSVTYNKGLKQTAKIKVTVDGVTLVEGTDYIVTGKKTLTNPGTEVLTIEGIGKYAGSVKVNFTMKKAKLNLKYAKITVKEATYDGKTKNAAVTVYVNGKKLSSKAYKISGTTSRKTPGSNTLTITGKGDYTGSQKVTFTVAKATQKLTAKASKSSVKYSSLKKKSQTLTLKVTRKDSAKISYKSNSKKITVNSKGKVTLKKGLGKGTYKITVTTKATKYYKAASKTITITVK